MRKKLLCFLLCLFLLPLGVIRDAGGDGITRCLLIGCDQFVSMPDTEPAGANNVETSRRNQDTAVCERARDGRRL